MTSLTVQQVNANLFIGHAMKSTYKLAVFLFIAILPSLGYSESILKLGEGVNLFAINGKEIPKGSGFLSTKSEFSLPDSGTNQILVSYTADIKNGDSYELEESELSVIKFAASDQQITLSAPSISSTKQLEAFSTHLNWSLTTSDNTPVSYKVNRLPLEGFRIGVDYEQKLSEFNRTSAEAAIPPAEAIAPPVEPIDAHDTEQAVILKMLQHWYKLASPETREKFKASL
ncbi:DUF2057 domain-containing protein [Marinobacter halodurans]|uniref:DUF2057 domain-containing protein n=1 Tax=Marinobacter halodurans TaxID=2528979 RepID=A0ABY1ZDI8_9GAMM|nr:DUF2057 domain-containing protein [Marinobacter halodurans]TBW46916.1 DUF2057 domain-containing protein [Marinobacter halodurans]